MATKEAKPVEAEQATAAETQQVETKQAAPKFTAEKLQPHCQQLFGVSSCTFAGATHGMTEEYTVEEMKQHIKKWCGQEVK